MTTQQISSVKTQYNGVWYRSALEADWAATFDKLGVYYEYEPEPLRLPSGVSYDCDFYLPTHQTYCEAKGAHNDRLWKPREFAAVLRAVYWPQEYQVIILRAAGPGGAAAWETADGSNNVRLIECDSERCTELGGYSFTDYRDDGTEYCRRCWREWTGWYLGYTSVTGAPEGVGIYANRLQMEHVARPGAN